MGSKHSKLQGRFVEAILTESERDVKKYLLEHPELAKATIYGGKTNPMCRAACLGRTSVAMLLVQAGADVNQASEDQRTPFMWAICYENLSTAEFLITQGARVDAVDEKGLNALDLAVLKMKYKSALHLYQRGHLTEFQAAQNYRQISV